MIVVAHPDDETIGMGAQLCRFRDALLVQVTDGAPRDGRRCGGARISRRLRIMPPRAGSSCAAALEAGAGGRRPDRDRRHPRPGSLLQSRDADRAHLRAAADRGSDAIFVQPTKADIPTTTPPRFAVQCGLPADRGRRRIGAGNHRNDRLPRRRRAGLQRVNFCRASTSGDDTDIDRCGSSAENSG